MNQLNWDDALTLGQERRSHRHERASKDGFQLAEAIMALRHNVPSGAALTATLIGTVRHISRAVRAPNVR
jgi:hypothetical protein